jgi:hypothetical protein
MLNASVRGLSVIETRSVLQNMNVHYCCMSQSVGLVWTRLAALLGMCVNESCSLA